MKRRVCLCAALAMLPVVTQAQPAGRQSRVAVLSGSTPDANVRRNMVEPFNRGLRELGYVDGHNIRIDYRWSEGRPDRLPGLLAELLQLQPDVLVTSGPRPSELAKSATRSIPIVALAVNDPVLTGLAESLARPGGNITGISSWGGELVARRLQLLKDLVPSVRRYAVLTNPITASSGELTTFLAGYARTMGVDIRLYEASEPGAFEPVFAAMERDQVGAVLVLADATFYLHRARLAELCTSRRLPSVWGGREYLEGGGLASFQSDFAAIFHRGAALVDKILKGAKAGEMPFERASKLELVVNRKAARALGITVPAAVLVAADEVIE